MKGKRQRIILERIHAEGTVTVLQLATDLGVSEITARRDLLELEEAGFSGGCTAALLRRQAAHLNIRTQCENRGTPRVRPPSQLKQRGR